MSNNPFESIEQRLDHIEGLLIGLSSEKAEKKKSGYLTRLEAARLLHLTLPTLHEYTKEGVIQGHRIGRRVLYTEAAIEEAVKAIPAIRYKRR
ncbi:helix-turn-helix domain-containing protein [bacterium]|nr:helix-turn-helix domain-containing protein [bacterium]